MKLFQRQDRFHPCCGFNLQSVVPRLVPGMQFAGMKLALTFVIFGMFQNWETLQRDKIVNPANYYLRLLCWSGYFLYILSTDGLAFLLWRGSHLKNPALIRIWLVASPITVFWIMGLLVLNIAKFRTTTATSSNFFVLSTGFCFLQCYLWYIIYYYMKEMEEENFMSSAMRTLTDEEVEEFDQGLSLCDPQFRIEDLDAPTLTLLDRIQHQRYKKEDFEIKGSMLQLDKVNPLGSGNYGTVYKGQLHRNKSNITVAVKTVDPETTDVLCFKALLMELKVMSYLGSHPNVVELLGASTEGIRDRNLLIISEYCGLGNLHLFLVGQRGLFCNLVKDGCLQQQNFDKIDRSEILPGEEGISTLDLVQWSREIACGMDYLGSKKVVHADLSARNVLLTDQKMVKLADFGLARQLYSYSVYVKTQKTPLPWRWLSLEALADMNFSISSDVWAYGVTLFEIFTLGGIPYPGYTFCLEFVEDLRSGLRPSRPPFAPQEIWSIMEQSWRACPTERPTFCEISSILQQKLNSG